MSNTVKPLELRCLYRLYHKGLIPRKNVTLNTQQSPPRDKNNNNSQFFFLHSIFAVVRGLWRYHGECSDLNWIICYIAKAPVLMAVATYGIHPDLSSWWRHQMETLSASLALCEGNPSATGGFPSQRPVTRNFDIFFDLLHKRAAWQTIETPVI